MEVWCDELENRQRTEKEQEKENCRTDRAGIVLSKKRWNEQRHANYCILRELMVDYSPVNKKRMREDDGKKMTVSQ
jgi:hypothetical protein